MNPLLQLANDMANFGTTLVLSGFKSDQTEELMTKYESVGFTVQKLFVRNHWVAAVLGA
jgi:ribosomal protein L11 methylase PrmA